MRATARRDRLVVAGRHDVDDLAAVGLGERGRDDPGAEAGADHGDLHSPITSGASSCTGRWNRRSPACVNGAERERDQHGADADLAAEHEPDDEHAALDHGAHDPEPVARAR